MGKRTLVLIVALVLAGVAGAAVWVFLSNVEEDIKAGQELVAVFKASVTIAEGTPGDLLLSQLDDTQPPILADDIASEDRPDNAFGSEDELRAFLTGKVAAGPISRNQILTRDQWVSSIVQVRPLADAIPEGKQAITIAASGERGVNGFINPGDRINVIVTIALPDESQEGEISSAITTTLVPGEEVPQVPEITITRFVLQGLRVIAIGQEIRPEADEPQPVDVTTPGTEEQPEERRDIVTLEVTSEEAEKLVFSFEQGSVWLTLVPEDFSPIPTEGVTRDTLFEE
ncbi:MAG TPA: Flp pilus assembly protein CpaB [Acidimicrobiia bacterium]